MHCSAAGVITKVAVKCVPTSTAVNTLMMRLSSFEGVQQTFHIANKHLAEVLSAFEFFDRQSMELALKYVQGAVNPFSDLSDMYVLVETSGELLHSPIFACLFLSWVLDQESYFILTLRLNSKARQNTAVLLKQS